MILMKKDTRRKTLKYLGQLDSYSEKAFDYLHISSKKSLFNYDCMKKMNYSIRSQFEKNGSIWGFSDHKIKKNKILSWNADMSEVGMWNIKEFNISGDTTGICVVAALEPFGNSKWFDTGLFTLGFVDINPKIDFIDINDNTLCISLFEPVQFLDFFEEQDFFKKKNNSNILKFDKFIKEKIHIKKQTSQFLTYKVPNGKYQIYNLISTRSWKNSVINEGDFLGFFIKLKLMYASDFYETKHDWDYGPYKYPTGEKYVGQLKNGKRHGKGTQTYPHGYKYVGYWKDDKYHGKGILTGPYYTKYSKPKKGIWKNGKLIK